MKVVQFKEFGSPDVLKYTDINQPAAEGHEVLLKVTAIGVNYADTARREGAYVVPTPLPFIPGAEVAGVIEEVGDHVKNFSEGDRVVTLISSGGYAEYAVADANSLIPIPEGVSDQLAAALPLQGLTAYHILKTMGRLTEGETVLVHAAAGGVGSLAVQLAKYFKAGKVIATASTEEKLSLAAELGADELVNYTEPNWREKVLEVTGGKGVDVALEMAGGEIFHETIKCMRSFGRVVVYGAASGEPPVMYPAGLMNRNLSVVGFFLPQIMKKPELFQRSLKEILQLVMEDKLKLTLGGVYPLEDAALVHELLQGRRTKGKIILTP
ncbi:quinone oxidoreductase [Halobacillus sp. Marseille-Q1614]|uniref:quinone oxidoreductase family protein n=1 Tax=Halobacillus sp. Marseille-Q1614 TaxID=2709134 RepID=UPI00156FE09E|nr:quinone oxidoreductase [Halobacillus sp. Marseille-Q1614]